MTTSAAISAAGSLGSGALGFMGAGKAAKSQQAGIQSAIAAMLEMFNLTRKDLEPYRKLGEAAVPHLQRLTGTSSEAGFDNPLTATLTRPFQPTIEELEGTPGYQFILNQGEKAVKNRFSARGLGDSGALGKGLVDYAEGVAGTTFQNQFGNYLTQNRQIFDIINSLVGTGANAAAQQGQFNMGAGNTLAGLYTGAGVAGAGGIVGQTNALTGGLQGIGGNLSQMMMLNRMFPDLAKSTIPGTPTIPTMYEGNYLTGGGGGDFMSNFPMGATF